MARFTELCATTHKKVYYTWQHAKNALSALLSKGRKRVKSRRLQIWVCRFCGSFHVGHTRKDNVFIRAYRERIKTDKPREHPNVSDALE